MLNWRVTRVPSITEPELELMPEEEFFSETELMEEEMLAPEETELESLSEEMMIPESECMPEEMLIPTEEESELEFMPDELLLPEAELMPEEEVMPIGPEFGLPEELTVSRCEVYRVNAYRYLNLYRRTRNTKYLCLYYRYFAAYRCCQLNI
jgi:hypothetical protein